MFKKLIVSHALRRRVSWAIAAVLILPFIFFFQASSRPTPGTVAGEIFGKSISRDTFNEYYRMAAAQLESQLGGELPEALRPMLIQSTWDWLLMLEEAKRRKIHVSDEQVRQMIRQETMFQENGQFSPTRYRDLVTSSGSSPQAFEDRLRQQLLVEALIQQVRNAVIITDEDVKAAYAASHEQLKAQMVVIPSAAFRSQAESALTDADFQASYDKYKNSFRIPEQFSVEYAGATREQLTAKATGADAAAIKEQVDKQLTALGLDLQENLDDRMAFDEIVKTRALIRQTAGPFSVEGPWNETVPDSAILVAARDLSEGEMSEVIRGESGVYVARVTKRIESRLPPLEEVRGQVTQRLIEENSRELAREAAEAFHRTLMKELEAGKRFEEIAASGTNLSMMLIAFTRSQTIEPLGAAPQVNAAAFETPLGEVTAPLEAPKGYVIFKPQERIPADMAMYETEAPITREQVQTQRQGEYWQQWIGALRQRAKLKSYVGEEQPA